MREPEAERMIQMARMQGFLPMLRVELDHMEKQVDDRVYQALANGTLTPDVSLQAWQEKAAIRKIWRRFDVGRRTAQAPDAG